MNASWSALAVLLVTACAAPVASSTHAPSPAASAEVVTDASRRIYWLAEEQFDRGRYALAVDLWRHALLQLPKTEEADAVRHALILRMGYGRLAQAVTTKTSAPAHDGIRMLERYLEWHEALFGDTERAREQRGEVYELLFELEEPFENSVAEDAESIDVVASVPSPESEPGPEASVTYEETGDGDAEFVRYVDVRRRTADPRVVREHLESDFSNADVGLVFGAYGLAPLNGPRPLLRVRTARWVDGSTRTTTARSTVRALADQVREPLLTCYLEAVAREGNIPTSVSLRLEESSNQLRATIEGGGLLDAWGDVCLADVLATAEVPTGVAVDTELVFFVQGERFMKEWDGASVRDELDLAAEAMLQRGPPERIGGRRSLPPIDEFAGSP